MIKNYIIDSDILIYFLKGKKEVVEQLLKIPSANLYTTRINCTELLYGAYNSTKIEENLKRIVPFLENFQIIEFNQNSSEIFAKLKSKLKKDGKIIADMDLMIASITIAENYTLVTNNTKHFERIKDIQLENWL